MAEFPYADWLTRQYKERAEHSNCWTDYLKAHGLANYCVAKDPREERRRLVYEIEVLWYKGKHPLTFDKHQKKTREHKRLLEDFRNSTTADFKSLEKGHEKLITNNEEVLSPANIERANEFSRDVFKASEKSTEQFRSVSKSIIESSVELLQKAGKTAPCKFAAIGLGSAAKGEVTPYSDLEYAFIVEHEDEYFEELAIDSYFRIGNLGETPLKCFDIEELKVEKGSTPILSSCDTVGYRIDGITEKAGNIPTGNGRGGQKLTLTVEGLMKLYRTSAESPFDGVAGDKSDMLSSTVLIYTNEGRDSHLYQQFLKERKMAERELTSNKDVIAKRRASFIKDVESYTFVPEFIKFQPPENLNVEVKTDIFRYPTLLANHLKLWLTLDDRYPWEVFDRLQERKALNTKECPFHIILAISLYVRTSAYLYSRTQRETISLYTDTPTTSKVAYQPPGGLFVVLGCLLAPLKHQIRENASLIRSDEISTKSFVSTLLGKLTTGKQNFLLEAEVNYFIGRYEPAMDIINKGIGCDILNSDSSTVIERIQQKDKTSTNKYVQLCGYLLYYTLKYRTAIDYLQWLIETQPGDTNLCKLLLAYCTQETGTGDYKSARLLLDQVKSTQWETSLFHPISSNSAHPDSCIALISIGLLYHNLGEYQQAIRCCEESLKIGQDLHESTSNVYTAVSHRIVGISLSKLGHHTSALEHLTLSLETLELMFASPSLPTASLCQNIGDVYTEQRRNYERALSYYKRALKIREALLGHNHQKVEVALTYSRIGYVYHSMSDYQNALEYHTESLDMLKTIHGKDTNHLDIAKATVYNSMGLTYRKQCDNQKALECHNKALEMMKAIYGADVNHPDIAVSYYQIGLVHANSDNYDQALEYLTKSLEMYRTVFGSDTAHPRIVTRHLAIGRVYKQTGDSGKAEEQHRKASTMIEDIAEEDRDQGMLAEFHQLQYWLTNSAD